MCKTTHIQKNTKHLIKKIIPKKLHVMARILGYGEDALTLWAMNSRLSIILKELKDDTKTEDCLVLFRPSFGRNGGNNSAPFGEFDAILSTKKKNYLIESKWDNLDKNNRTTIHLGPNQVLRHEIFAWLYTNWIENRPNNGWDDFFQKMQTSSVTKFNKPMAPKDSLLAKNLESVLKLLSEDKQNNCSVENILLHFYRGSASNKVANIITKNDNVVFKIINFDYESILCKNYIPLP